MTAVDKNTYVLGVGDKGKERLAILNELFGSSSRDLLLRAGLQKGKTILEIGCGTGNMTTWIAEQVGETGHVYAVDISEEQLTIAKSQAEAKNLNNVTFINSSVLDLKELPLVDMVYGRFIVMHIPNPFGILQHIVNFLKPDGCLVCEEGTNAVTCCYPFSPAFQKHRQLLLELAKIKGLDFNLGEKLFSYFHQLDLKNISANFVQPVYQTREQKLQIVLLIKEMRENIIECNLATEDELDQLIKDLYLFVKDDKYFASTARMTQIYGQC